MPQLPNNSHDLALWLLTQLENVQLVGDGVWQGILPSSWDFGSTVKRLEEVQGGLAGVSDERSRSIEFYPGSAKVYQTLADFFSHPGNLRVVPSIFTIRDLGYTHGKGDKTNVPEQVANYLAAASLCELLPRVADHSSNNGVSQHFIKSHDAKVEMRLEYQPTNLVPLPSLGLFAADFVDNPLHKDQKLNIVRSALLDVFKGKRLVTVGDFLPRFEEFMDNVRSSYVMYTADFSYEKIRMEVEKQNLEDTLRLNKTVSDIQNQLLALPAALLLAGAGIQKSETLKNLAIWIGVCIFAWLMRTLVKNQAHSIDAIQKEVGLRKQKLADQPDGVSNRFADAFNTLEARVTDQMKVLRGIRWAVVMIWFVVTAMIFSVFFPDLAVSWWTFLSELPVRLFNWTKDICSTFRTHN